MTPDRSILRRGAIAMGGGAVMAWFGFEAIASHIRGRIFLPERAPIAPLAIDGVSFEVLRVVRPDGGSLAGLLARAPTAKATVLFLHGNGGNATNAAAFVAGLVRGGYDLIVADYRGYGGNEGEPSEAGLVEDCRTFLAEARRLAGPRPLLLVGHSLGGALAILIAGGGAAGGLLTIAAVASVADLVPPVGRPFLRDGFDALTAARGLTLPWIVAHGEADDVVPYADAVRLAGAPVAPGRELILAPGLDHRIDPALLRRWVDRLYARVAAL